MPSCIKPARTRASLPLFFLAAFVLSAQAFEIRDSFRSEKFPDGWSLALSPGSKGSIVPTTDGALFSCEVTRFGLLKRDLPSPGTDANPLLITARLRTAHASDCSMYVFWDNKNYVYFKLTPDAHVNFGWVANGVDHAGAEYNIARDGRGADGKTFGKEASVRLLAVSKNLAFFVSGDGVTWRRSMEANARPGPAGAAPKVMFGRGFTGEKEELSNDLSNERQRTALKSMVLDVVVTDHPAPPLEALPEIKKKETWDQTLAALEPAGIPKTWTFVGPAPDKMVWGPKDWIDIENWNTIKEFDGRKVKVVSWTRPEDELEDSSVDLRDQMEHVRGSVVLCRTEFDWPLSGEAILWYDCGDVSRVYVNNSLALAAEGHDWWSGHRALKDRRAIPVYFNKGKNVVKISIKQQRGDAQFFLRAERNDPAYRAGLMEKMVELFPPQEGGWRSAAALLEIARLREEAFDFEGALKGYAHAMEILKADEESRLRAFEGGMRVHTFLRDFDSAAKAARDFLVLYPRAEGSAGAVRAALRNETLAGHAKEARERIAQFETTLGRAEMLRAIAGALADRGDKAAHVSMLAEMSTLPELSTEDRARSAIESAVWRWEYERQRRQTGVEMNSAELDAAAASMRKALDILPGGKNPAVQQLLKDAAAQKAPDKSLGALWGAALLALNASEPETAYYFALNKAYPIALPLKDAANNEIKDQNQFKTEAWKLLREQCGDPAWSGPWRWVGFRRIVGGQPAATDGPEKNSDASARYGDKAWAEFDPENDKTGMREFGFDVKRFIGDSQIVYFARDFETAAALDSTLHLSNSGAWTAWIDGKLIGRELGPDEFRIEDDRFPLRLSQGKHRLLIRLEIPSDTPVQFRARIGAEPHLAMLLYIHALCAEQFPTTPMDRSGDLNVIRDAIARRIAPDAFLGYAENVCQVFDDQKSYAIEQIVWASNNLRDMNQDALAANALRGALRRLEDGPNYQGRSFRLIELSRALARALVHMGSTAAADSVLRDAANRYTLPAAESALCVAWRGALRRDLGMSQAALPFFERCAREGHLNDEARAIVGPGLEWARFQRPERVLVESSRDVQTQLDGVRRQLSGAPEDAEKAMRSLGEILRATSGSLVKTEESPFMARYVGAREHVRVLIGEFTAEQRALYEKVVGAAAAKHLLQVSKDDPAGLENAALEFPNTRESQSALNRAGNLYMDRGKYKQALSVFQTMLRESPGLKDEKLSAKITYCTKQSSATPIQDSLGQYMGSTERTGALSGPSPAPAGAVWAHPAIASGTLDNARSIYGRDAQTHLQSQPVTDGTRVFIGAMESLRAFDLASGNILWTQTWATGAASGVAFNGFPSNCPAVGAGKVYVRAQSTASMLKCFSADTGALRWSTDSQPELRKLVWISDPALAYGTIYAVCIEPGDFNVHCAAALDAETGRLRWRTPLANGSTGVKLNDAYYQAAFHMGPPAIDAGELYVETGLASIAALNAFTGEPRWLSNFPRISLGDPRRGLTGVFEFGTRTFKVFSRAPLPPMVDVGRIILAPHDGNGLMAFDRRDGTMLWHRELIDARYIAGLVDGNIIACDEGLIAVNAETGATQWKTELEGGGLAAAPTLSDGAIYLPARAALKRVDARSGRELGSAVWDARIGWCGNLLVTDKRIIGVTDSAVVALGTDKAESTPLPLYEARRLEADGKLEEAAERYKAALASEKDDLPIAAAARIRVLKTLGKRDEALAEIARFEREAPVKLSAMGGLWRTRRDLIVRSLRLLMGENPPDPAPPVRGESGLAGVLAYSDCLTGENAAIARLADGPPNRLYVRLNGDVQCLNISSSAEVLWSAYVGTNVKKIFAAGNFLGALSENEVAILDRNSGEAVSRITMPRAEPATGTARERALALALRLRQASRAGESFAQACIQDGRVFTVSDQRLSAWDAATGRQLWSRAFMPNDRAVDNGLSARADAVTRAYIHRDEIYISAYDPATGAELRTFSIDKQQRTAFSQDNHYLIARFNSRLTCADLFKMEVLWRREIPEVEYNYSSMEFNAEGLRYSGTALHDSNRHIVKYLDIATGADTLPALVDAPGEKSGGGTFVVTDRGYKISRLRVQNGALEPAWTIKIPQQSGVYYSFNKAILASGFFHLLQIRNFDNGNRDQLFLRTISWETGQQISEQVLPGTPLYTMSQYTGQKVYTPNFVLAGASLVYAAKEGIYTLRTMGETPSRAADALRKEVTDPGVPLERIKQLRRGLAGLEESEAMAFITPADARVDGDLAEWRGSDPVLLTGRANYVAMAPDAQWNGANDLSAKIFTGWNQEGITVAVEVQDDAFVPPRPGSEGISGDRVRLVIDGRPGDHSTLEPGESFVATLALEASGSVFVQEFGSGPENSARAEGKAGPTPSGHGCQYEFFVPWTMLRKDGRERPGANRELRLGVAVFEDDGGGTKGALEWGAGATLQPAMPMWLSRLTLIDASAEKIERYRKVIAMAADTPEALRFLKVILLSKRGPNAEAESIAELEHFITEHPSCANTVRALAMLKQNYIRVNDPNPTARLEKFMKTTKVPEQLRKLLNCAFKMWVYPDPQKPPQMIMAQFSNTDWNANAVRAYWGQPAVPWAKDGTDAMKRFGEIPKPGQWTELTISPFELGMDTLDIRGFALTFQGGNMFFDRVRVISGDTETVLIDDALPEHMQSQYSEVQFVDNPRHDGAKAFTLSVHEANIDVHNTHFNLDNWQPIINFFDRTISERPKETAALQDIYRRSAQLINDTPEGLALLRKTIDLYEGDKKEKAAKAIGEIKAFIKANISSPTGYDALKLAYEVFSASEEPDPLAKCDELIRDVKPSLTATRQFYADRAPTWMAWQVLGPYQAVGERRGMEVATEVERGVNLNFKTQQYGREIGWKKIVNNVPPNPKVDSSIIDLRAALNAEKESWRGPYFGYAYTKFTCPSKRKALIAFGADDVVTIWINGRRVVNEVYTYPQKDKEAVEVELRNGENEVLIKTGIQHGRLAFVFRIADLDGKPFADISNE